MAHKIIWSLQARDDLREIVAYIAADNPTVAESFGYQLMSKVDLLENFPQLGRVVPEENDENDENIRELILRPYRIGIPALLLHRLHLVAFALESDFYCYKWTQTQKAIAINPTIM